MHYSNQTRKITIYKQEIGESNVVFHDNNSCMSRNYKSEELQEEGT